MKRFIGIRELRNLLSDNSAYDLLDILNDKARKYAVREIITVIKTHENKNQAK
jgi:hypothetical protein